MLSIVGVRVFNLVPMGDTLTDHHGFLGTSRVTESKLYKICIKFDKPKENGFLINSPHYTTRCALILANSFI